MHTNSYLGKKVKPSLKKRQHESSDEDEGEEAENEESEEEKLSHKELPQRNSRGKRMNTLVGRALEEDEEFWGQDFFREGDDDESFDAHSSEAKDSFDSDFDKSEHSNEGEGEEDENERQIRKQERAKKKKVKFMIPPKKKPPVKKSTAKPKPKPVKVEKQTTEDAEHSSNASEAVPVSRRSERMAQKYDQMMDSEDEDFSEKGSQKQNKNPVNKAQKNDERKREIKEKNKAFLEMHGIHGDTQDKWIEILSKDKLTPMEKIQEAAFTEIINKESLNYLQELENERVNEMVYRDRRPKGPSVKLIQDIKPGHYNSRMVFPSSDFYPKNFNTRKEKRKESQRYQMSTCMITGKKARYKDPLTLTPFANKQAFKVVRERFFQKEEDKLNMRIHIINELLNQKRAKLKRFRNFEAGYDVSQDQSQAVSKSNDTSGQPFTTQNSNVSNK